MPKSDPLTLILIDYFHRKYLHTGPHLLLSILRQKYWILSTRDIIRQRIWISQIGKANTWAIAKAFFHTGVDYTGGFSITMGRYRSIKFQKAYVSLFVCLATKALHLVSSLSTEPLISAFKRFISRNYSAIFSDRCTKNYFDEFSCILDSPIYKDSLPN